MKNSHPQVQPVGQEPMLSVGVLHQREKTVGDEYISPGSSGGLTPARSAEKWFA